MAVIREQLDLPRWPIKLGNRQIRVLQRGHRDRRGIDRVGLAALPPRAPAAAISWVGTRITCSPAASRSRSRRRVR
jgi:hypothetical protein